jgi:hypothetical protein
MEWLGLLLLYLISGYVKKRQQNQKRRQIEEDPEWDSETVTPPQESSQNLDQLLNTLFDQTTNLDPESPTIPIQTEDSEFEQLETPTKENNDFVEEIIDPDEIDLSEIDEQAQAFEEKIYHSKLADRKEMHFGKKWLEKTILKKELFNSKKALQKSIIIKEVLDKPLALRQ